MTEFRKREDIDEEIDLLQHLTEKGAPSLKNLSGLVRSLVKNVDPRLMGELEAPPLPGEEPMDYLKALTRREEARRRARRLRLLALLLLLGAGGLFLLSRWVSFSPRPATKPGEGMGKASERPQRSPAPPSPEAVAALPSPPTLPSAAPETPSAGVSPEPLPSASPPAPPAAVSGSSHYTVRPGDTLYRIAEAQLGRSERWGEIYALNRDRLISPSLIHAGVRLAMPSAQAAPSAHHRSVAPPLERQAALKQAKAFTYQVKPGDSLSLLARRFLGSEQRWAEIYYLNTHRLSHPHWIQPGQMLDIPARRTGVRYVVRAGDSLWAIAERQLGDPTAWPRIYRANRDVLSNPRWIQPGQALRLPR